MADYSLGTAHGQITIDADTSGVDKANQAMGNLGKGSQSAADAANKVGTTMVVAGAAVAGGLGLAVKTAADFEQELSGIKAVSGATSDEMGKLHDKALQIGKDTAFGATEAAQAMSELAKAGIGVNDILGGAADATVALAAATGVDMPTAATIASNAMNVFGLKASEMGTVVDSFSQAANASAIDVTDLGMSMQQVGAVAHLAGLSMKDTVVAIGEMGDAGIKGSDAGTSLKTMLMNLQPQTKKASEEMQRLGIITKDGSNQFYDQQGNVKSLADIQQVLQTALKGMSAEQKQAALQTLFGSDAIRAAAVMAENGAAGYQKFTDKMTGSGTAADQAKTRMDNLKGSWEQAKGSLETAGIAIGETLIPVLKDLANWLGSIFDWFNSLPGPTQSMITYILAGAAAFLILGGGALKLVKSFQEIFGAIGTLISWLFRKNAAEATSAASSEASALASSLAWLKSVYETVALWAMYAAEAVKNAILVSATWLRETAIATTATVAGWVSASAKAIVEWVKMAAAATANAVRTGAVWVAETAASTTALVASWVAASAKAVAQWVIMATTAGVNAALVAGAWLLQNGAAVLTSLASLAVAVGTTVAGWITMAVTAMVNAAIVAAAWLIAFWPVALIIVIVAAVIAAIIIFWDQIVAAFQAGAAWVSQAMQTAWQWIQQAWDWIVQKFQEAWNWIVSIFTGIGQAIQDAWNTIIGAFQQAGQAVWQALQQTWNWITEVWNNVIGFFKQIPGWIMGVFSGAINWLVNFGQDILNGLWNGIKNIWNAVTGWFGQVGGWIKDAFSGAGQWLLDAGMNLIRGLWNGIVSVKDWILRQISGFVNDIVAGIKNFFGIGSPSKVFRDEVGKWLPAGIAVGIDKNTQDAIDAAKAMVNATRDSVSMSSGGPAAFWDGTSLGAGSVPMSPEVASYAAAQGESKTININTTINNPVVELDSDSEARRLRTLSALGAF